VIVVLMAAVGCVCLIAGAAVLFGAGAALLVAGVSLIVGALVANNVL
jgi:hypothetical protein